MGGTARDVVVVGRGPVGQLAAILLGARGWEVVLVERWPEPYPLPRAVTFDHEVGRVLGAAGIGGGLAAVSEAATEYEWRNAAGQVLLRFAWDRPGITGWPRASMFAQPELEALLAKRIAAMPNVEVRAGCEAVAVHQDDRRAVVRVRDGAGTEGELSARYVVGCDGAKSTVRRFMDTTVTDLGFFHDWLIVDVVPGRPREWRPANLQICDPARPTTVVSGGPGRRRFEFMRLPGESAAELNRAETAWRLIAPWGLGPDNTVLERHTVYTFQARWADRWRDGRLLLAGDAAHLMPPFAGQGMCAGLRDAANLAWKLDLVLSGRADPDLLDSYTAERTAHVREAIETSIELGKVICVLDPDAAAERDRAMNAAGGGTVVDTLPDQPLTTGVLADRPADRAGMLCPQGRVRYGGREGGFDEVVGTGFAVLCAAEPGTLLDDGRLAFCERLGAHVLRIVAPGEPGEPAEPGFGTVVDLDGVYRALLDGHEAVVVRPDFYVFGAGGAAALVDGLRDRLGASGVLGA
ncbi:bifunctional 3-(3-hydroxy-phenyl)propionate/3-hydroxycinnamic acid hydroxylase MhpA [Actinomadura fibrosa]|uniref:Bifunctional 3-(3-hydroxy-phenyl)propionate/3-hydroxycinnamic acid hydroxylase n=1 Tax=Actinomadura fibrosa TaxID=111802 RepID=A0ABW2XDJ8_9ACTN|nr:bifunctional 3-(3-hydroxy-phenyl)propionate/3-hydroxycinnamic acid hydroxylase [Actinomadura fibrosa]